MGAPGFSFHTPFLRTVRWEEETEVVKEKEEREKKLPGLERGKGRVHSTQLAPQLLYHHTRWFFLPHSISPTAMLWGGIFPFGVRSDFTTLADRSSTTQRDGSLQSGTRPQPCSTRQHTTPQQHLLIFSPPTQELFEKADACMAFSLHFPNQGFRPPSAWSLTRPMPSVLQR